MINFFRDQNFKGNMFDVLLGFQSFPMIAVVWDVREMYLQIRIPPEDCRKLRFLWRKKEVDREPDTYEFEQVMCGVASAHFRAECVSQENARIYEREFPLAFVTVIKSTYKDDSLDRKSVV